MQKDIEITKYDEVLMAKIGKSVEIVRDKLNVMSIFKMPIVFTVLRRIDCFIGQYSKDMSSRYLELQGLPAEVIRREMSKVSHSSLFYNVSGLNFSDIISHPDKIDFFLSSYVEGFNEEVKDILKKLDILGLIAEMKYVKVLYDVVNYYAGIDLGSSVTSIDICNVFRNAMQKRADLSTPNLYCYYAQAMLFGKEVKSGEIKIYDPVCGVGNLLNAVTFNAYSLYVDDGITVSIYGQEINDYDAAIMSCCSLLIGDDPQNIKVGNVITDDKLSDKKFEYIVADLPIGLPWQNFANEIYNESVDGRFSMGIPRHDSQLLFIQHIISKMSPSGSRAVIITNSNPLSGGDSNDSNIRKCILERDLLETVIALPKTSGSTIQKYMWVLSNKKASHRVGKVHLIDANLMKEKESCHIEDDMSLLNVVNQFYDLDFPEPYNQFMTMQDFGCYQISVKDHSLSKIIKIEVPLREDPNNYLSSRGIDVKDTNRYEILYDKTIDIYKIDMDKIFSQEEKIQDSEDLLSNMKESLFSVYHFNSLLDSLPKLTKSVDTQMINEGIFNIVPSHWKRSFLRDVIDCKNGKKYKDESKDLKSIPVFSISDLRGSENTPSSYTDDPSATMMHENDVVIVSKGSNAGDILIGQDGALGQGMILVQGNEQYIHEDYLYYLMEAINLRKLASGAVIKSLSIKDIENTFVCLPSLEEQAKIVEYLYSIEGAKAGVYESLEVVIPSIELYWKSLLVEIVSGKYIFS